MGTNNNSLRPRYDSVELDYSADEVVKPSKLPPWKSFQSTQNKKSTAATFLVASTSEDAPLYNFPHSYPNKTSSSNFSFSHVPRFDVSKDSSKHLGTTYQQSWDDRVRLAKGATFSRASRNALHRSKAVDNTTALLLDSGHKTSLSTSMTKSPMGKAVFVSKEDRFNRKNTTTFDR